MPAYTSFTIAGAGNLGRNIAQSLLKQGFKVSVLSRSSTSDNAKALSAAGATVQEVDYSNADSVARAVSGAEVVINTLGQEALHGPVQETLIAQTKKAGVQLYVPNDWGIDYDFSEKAGVQIHPFLSGKVALGKQLEQIGLPYLHFFVGLFGSYQALLFNVNREARTAKVLGAGNTKFISTAEQDIGDFVAKTFATLPRAELENASLRVAPSSRFTANELFAEAEKRDGQKWTIEHTNLEQGKADAYNASLGPASFFAWLSYALEQGAVDNPDDNALIGFQSSVDLVDLVLGKASA